MKTEDLRYFLSQCYNIIAFNILSIYWLFNGFSEYFNNVAYSIKLSTDIFLIALFILALVFRRNFYVYLSIIIFITSSNLNYIESIGKYPALAIIAVTIGSALAVNYQECKKRNSHSECIILVGVNLLLLTFSYLFLLYTLFFTGNMRPFPID